MLVTLSGIVTLVRLVQPSERLVPDAGDRQAIDRARDGHVTTGTGVSRDGDRAVVGDVIELRLHRGGGR